MSTEHRIISLKTLKEKKYYTLNLPEKYTSLLGMPAAKFTMMCYGPSGSGKSVYALQFCEELGRHGKVLYNSHEERDNKSIQDTVNDFNINSNKIAVGLSLPFDVMVEKIRRNHYSFVVIDSIQYMQLTYDQLKELHKMTKKKKKLTPERRARKQELKEKFEWVYMNGKQKKVRKNHFDSDFGNVSIVFIQIRKPNSS